MVVKYNITTEKVEFPISGNVHLNVHYRAEFHVNFLKFAHNVVGNLTFIAVYSFIKYATIMRGDPLPFTYLINERHSRLEH